MAGDDTVEQPAQAPEIQDFLRGKAEGASAGRTGGGSGSHLETAFDDIPEVVFEASLVSELEDGDEGDEDDDAVEIVVEISEPDEAPTLRVYPALAPTPTPTPTPTPAPTPEAKQEAGAWEDTEDFSEWNPAETAETEADTARWQTLVTEIVALIDEMEDDALELESDFAAARICRHVAVQLTGLLARNGVTLIGNKEQGAIASLVGKPFDRVRHQPVGPVGADAEGMRIAQVVRPGFLLGTRVLRRAKVEIEKDDA